VGEDNGREVERRVGGGKKEKKRKSESKEKRWIGSRDC
jgi:hypothetical protein